MGLAGRLLASAVLLAAGALPALHTYGGREYFNVNLPTFYFDGAPGFRKVFEAAAEEGSTLSLSTSTRVALDILRRAPMDFSALVYWGYFANRRGDLAGADNSLALGITRNPRNSFAHMWAAEIAAKRGDYSTAVREIDTLIVIDPGSGERYLDYLVTLAADEASHDAIVKLMESRPAWGAGLVRKLERSSFSEDLLARLASTQEGALQGLLNRMVAQGRIEEAFVVWMDSLHVPKIGFEWPYDGDFRGAPGRAPFNWSFPGHGAELQPGGGLSVAYQGSGEEEFANEIILLGPGYYGLAVQAKGRSEPRGGVLRWKVSCFPSGVEVARVNVRPTESAKIFAAAFNIPAADCPAQKISLRGAPGELPIDVTADVSSVKIRAMVE